MTDFHPAYHQACRDANERIAALEAENGLLKCCGNCGTHSEQMGECLEDDGGLVLAHDPCHFTPSRWTVREDG